VTPAARLAAAIDLLTLIEATNRPADAAANEYFRARRFIGSGDRRDVSDRVWRILRARRRLQWWLGEASTPRLLVAASLVLEGIATEGVAGLFSGGRFAAEALTTAETAALAPLAGHTLDHPDMPLPVRLEVPDWILPLLQARFGERLGAEMAALAEEAPLDLRVNLLKIDREGAQAALAAEGIVAEPTPLSPWGLRVQGRRPVTTGAAFRAGLIEIQDEGSQLVAALVGAAPEMRVADFCAGAGGKTLALAMTMGNRGHIVACDVSVSRLDGAVRRLRRAGVHNVERHLLAPGDKWTKRRAAGFDRVLVDAPCTGSGTWRRNPDGRARLSRRDLDELLVKQISILDQASRLVRKTGRLVYATCSLLTDENESQVSAFVARHPEFTQVDQLSLTPARDGTDAFYAVALERAG
jgi:16S rRNA (cytosine967-C5)-methyltransferase